jgi:hypothetical protein
MMIVPLLALVAAALVAMSTCVAGGRPGRPATNGEMNHGV